MFFVRKLKREIISPWMAFGLAVICIAATATLAYAGEQGWVLTQRSNTLGDQYVYITPSAIKIVNPGQGFGSIATSPNWNAILFNDKTKFYYPLSYEKWRGKLASKSSSLAQMQWVRGEVGVIAGLHATKYVMRNPTARAPHEWISAEYWAATDIKVSPRLTDLLSSIYGVPDKSSVPLRLAYTQLDGTDVIALDTYRGDNANMPRSYFNCPSNYQLAKTEAEVLLTNERRQLINDVAKNMNAFDTENIKNKTITLPPGGLRLPDGRQVNQDDVDRFMESLRQKQQ